MDDHPDIEMPAPSIWPIVLALGMALVAVGVVWTLFISLAGVVVILVAIAGWTWENRSAGQEEDHA